jgi:hypothetical protein
VKVSHWIEPGKGDLRLTLTPVVILFIALLAEEDKAEPG